MEIRNVTQYAHFLSASGFAGVDPVFNQAIQCINNYAALCNCAEATEKANIYNTCNTLYSNGVGLLGSKYKNLVLSKISSNRITFYAEGGKLLTIISR